MSVLTDWLDGIRRSRLTGVLGAYLAASFGILQVVDIFTNHLGLPNWVFPLAVVLLVVGLPIVAATAMLQAPQPATASATAPVSPAARRTTLAHVHWLTWRRALLGGVAAFVGLTVLTGAYMGMRALGIGPVGSLIAKGALRERGRVLVADFRAPRGDTLLAATVTDAFRLDLAQSPALTVLDAEFVRSALGRMERGQASRLDDALAREIAQREGVAAVITGELGAIGGGYVLAAQIVAADSGQVLATFRETAHDSTELLPALDRLARALRERVGESLRTIRAAPPLEQVTTASLPALRAYSRAVRLAEYEGNQIDAVPLLENAIARDSGFAMAYRKLSVVLGNMGTDRKRQLEAVQLAYAHRDRLTDRERGLVEASYHMVRNQWTQAAASYEALLAEYPDFATAAVNLGLTYGKLRRLEDAERMARRAVTLDSSNLVAEGNLIEAQVANGRLADARHTLAAAPARFQASPQFLYYSARLAAVRGDYDGARSWVRRGQQRYAAVPAFRGAIDVDLAMLAAVQGRLAEARQVFQGVAGEFRRAGLSELAVFPEIAPAAIDAVILEDSTRAGKALAALAVDQTLASVPPANRRYLQLGVVFAVAGRPARAREYLRAYDEATPPELRTDPDRHALLGMILLDEHRPAQAIDELQRGDEGPCLHCPLPDLAGAYDAAGQPDSARAVYERYLDIADVARLETDWLFLARIHERLAELYAAAGDRPRAAHHAAEFLALWANADLELQPRVRAMRTLLAQLSPDAPPARPLPPPAPARR